MAGTGTKGLQKSRSGKAGAATAVGLMILGPSALAIDSSPAHARLAPQAYEIAPGPIGDALSRLADESGAHLVFDAALTRHVSTRGVRGKRTLEEALDELLTGTSLGYRIDPEGRAVTIVLAQNSGTLSDASGAEPLPPIDIGAQTTAARRDSEEGRGAGVSNSYASPTSTSGTKTDTPVMETPLNVQTVTRKVLVDRQVTTIQDALTNVSGVTFTTGAGNGGVSNADGVATIKLRGFDATAIFRNGFRDVMAIDRAIGPDFANIDRVEVMKGAPAILYGLTEPGGLVDYITKRPQASAAYSVEQQFQSYDYYRTIVGATGPVTPDKSVLYRIDMAYQNNGYFIDDVHTSKFFVAPVVTWNLSSRTQVNVDFEYGKGAVGAAGTMIPTYYGRLVTIPKSRNYGEKSGDQFERYLVGVDWSHEFDDNWKFKHRVQYTRGDFFQQDSIPLFGSEGGVPSRPFIVIWNDKNYFGYDAFTTEADLTGRFYTGELKHEVLLGADFYRTNKWRAASVSDMTSIDAFAPVHPGQTFSVFDPPLLFDDSSTSYHYGVYGQDQIELPFGLHLMGGVRYQSLNQLPRSLTSQPYGAGYWDYPQPQRAERVTPRVGALWRARDWLSVYANYAEGFGPNDFSTAFPNKPVAPSDARQWEIGAKTEFFGGRLRAAVAYFELTKTNVPTDDPAHPGFSIVTGEVLSKGVELDVQGEVTPGWNVILAYANTEALITKSNNNDVGERFDQTPRNTASAWSTYEFRQDALSGLKFGGGVTYRDAQRTRDFSGQKLHRDLAPYATVDLMAAYSFFVGPTKLTAQFNVTNLLDHTYYQGGATTGAPIPGWSGDFRSFGSPRVFKGSIKAEF